MAPKRRVFVLNLTFDFSFSRLLVDCRMSPPPAWTSDSRGRYVSAGAPGARCSSGPSLTPCARAAPAPTGSMDAVRALLRPPSASGHARAQPPDEPLEWTQPSSTRVRARPSSLYGRVRASPTFPLSRRGQPGADGDADGRIRGATSRAASKERRVQRDEETDAQDGASSAVRLGAFGEVADMTLETVNFLIRVLEDRRHELMDSGSGGSVRSSRTIEARAAPRGPDREVWTVRTDAQETIEDMSSSERAPASSPRQLPRVHSYEALVRLEGILESRHQQLMQEGLGDILHDHEYDLATSLVPMDDIQDEVKRVYTSLHADAVEDSNDMTRSR